MTTFADRTGTGSQHPFLGEQLDCSSARGAMMSTALSAAHSQAVARKAEAAFASLLEHYQPPT
eukprot:2933923-Amphidinium_carterae.1